MVEALFDTNILIDYLRGSKGSRGLIEKLKTGEISGYVSVLTVAELVAGRDAEQPDKRDRMWDLLDFFTRISVDEEIAKASGEMRRLSGISLTDAVIAATAASLRCKLLTQDIRGFSGVAGVDAEKPY
ncbi:MAG: PIN domain-containing protein [Candidatus Micrarchaeota archaeon]|nr:PIN domain-containing protein [Candidatus Micrarchaeota archaeon]